MACTSSSPPTPAPEVAIAEAPTPADVVEPSPPLEGPDVVETDRPPEEAVAIVPEGPIPMEVEIAVEEIESMAERGLAALADHARVFDLYVRGKLGKDATVALKRSCQPKRAANPFCFSIRRAKSLERKRALKDRIPVAPVRAEVKPIPILRDGDRITNWKTLKASKIAPLLKGLEAESPESLDDLARRALAEKRCPNRLAPAVAATLEDRLPNPALLPRLADLYEKGAACAGRRDGTDREHFRTRAALLSYWAGDYRKAEVLLAKVRPADAFSGRPLFWLARAREKQGKTKEARETLKRLISNYPFSFHALAAATLAGLDPADRFLERTRLEKAASRTTPAASALLKQVEALRQYGYQETAVFLVDWALEQRISLPAETRVYLTSLGDDNTRVTELGILLVVKPSLISRDSLQLAYPTTVLPLVEQKAGSLLEGSVDPFLLLAIARKESQFNPKAISIANARGLLQLNPETAKKLAPVSEEALFDPATNIELGAKYVRQLLKLLGGTPLVVAAYNAGEASVQNWVKRFPKDDPILFCDLIPYRETRDYVGYVLSNYFWYRRLYSDKGGIEGFRKILTGG